MRSRINFHVTGGHLIAVACILGATVLMAQGRDGWGWLLFIAIIAG